MPPLRRPGKAHANYETPRSRNRSSFLHPRAPPTNWLCAARVPPAATTGGSLILAPAGRPGLLQTWQRRCCNEALSVEQVAAVCPGWLQFAYFLSFGSLRSLATRRFAPGGGCLRCLGPRRKFCTAANINSASRPTPCTVAIAEISASCSPPASDCPSPPLDRPSEACALLCNAPL